MTELSVLDSAGADTEGVKAAGRPSESASLRVKDARLRPPFKRERASTCCGAGEGTECVYSHAPRCRGGSTNGCDRRATVA
jgi:hypothetical protein